MESKLLAKSGDEHVTLKEHLQQVADYARMIAEAYRQHWELLLGRETADKVSKALLLAALTHDLGKAAEGFQRSLHERKFRWEFRHEVLSASLLLSAIQGDPINEIFEWAIAAVLTHHRDLNDSRLEQDCGWFPLPTPEIVREARERFQSKVSELEKHWRWLEDFCKSHHMLHGLSLPKSPKDIPLPADFLEKQRKAISQLTKLTEQNSLALLLTRGWLMASDHAVSAGVDRFLSQLPEPRFPPLRPFQKAVSDHQGNAFLEAPTGSGKTNAAIAWALRNRKGGERIFYLLPYQASIEAMAHTLEQLFGRENVAVLHARALDYAFREHFEQTGEYESAARQAILEGELNRLAHKPIKVTTPFQLIKWLFGVPRFEIGISEMVGGLFVFDEIHAYDAHVIAIITEMVRFLKQLGGRFLFMSATFPRFLKEILKEALEHEVAEFSLDCPTTDEWTRQFLHQARHVIRWHDKMLEEMLPEIIEAIHQNRKVLIVANRVAQAQEIYRCLREKFDGIYLLHSRFARKDRVEKERSIINAMRDRESSRLVRALVATQVIEVSLDISFDLIFTEVAPVDDLLQRFGRVNRYGEHAQGVQVHVSREYNRERLIRVYDEERLKRTLEFAPEDGTPLTVNEAAKWVQKVYENGWTNKEHRRYEQARSAFENVLSALRPLSSLSKGEEEFYHMFQSVEVLPSKLYHEYDTYIQNKRYFLANQLLVPVPIGTFHILNNKRLLTRQNDIIIAHVTYDSELGILIQEIDVDTNFI